MESLTKVFGSQLLISEDSLKALDDLSQFRHRKLGLVRVKGKAENISIYEIIPDSKIKDIEQYQLGVLCFELGLDHYQKKNFLEAKNLLERTSTYLPNDKATKLYYDHCIRALKEGVHADWEAVEVLLEK